MPLLHNVHTLESCNFTLSQELTGRYRHCGSLILIIGSLIASDAYVFFGQSFNHLLLHFLLLLLSFLLLLPGKQASSLRRIYFGWKVSTAASQGKKGTNGRREEEEEEK